MTPICTACHHADLDMTGSVCLGCLSGAGSGNFFSLVLMPLATETIQ